MNRADDNIPGLVLGHSVDWRMCAMKRVVRMGIKLRGARSPHKRERNALFRVVFYVRVQRNGAYLVVSASTVPAGI